MGANIGSMGSIEKTLSRGKEDVITIMQDMQKQIPEMQEKIRLNLLKIMANFADKLDQSAKIFDTKAPGLPNADSKRVVGQASQIFHKQAQTLRGKFDDSTACSKTLQGAIDSTLSESRRVMAAIGKDRDPNSLAVKQAAKNIMDEATEVGNQMARHVKEAATLK